MKAFSFSVSHFAVGGTGDKNISKSSKSLWRSRSNHTIRQNEVNEHAEEYCYHPFDKEQPRLMHR